MPIDVVCPACQKKMRAPDVAAGKRVKCPGCQGPLQIPVAPSAPATGATPSAVAAPRASDGISSSQVLPSNLAALPTTPASPGARFTNAPGQKASGGAVERWYLLAEDGTQYGPITRPELDQWYKEGRITAQSQVLREGAASWQWAPEVYPLLQTLAQAEANPAFDFTAGSAAPSSAVAANPLKTSSPARFNSSQFLRSEMVNYAAYASFAVAGLATLRALWSIYSAFTAISAMGGWAANNPRATSLLIGGIITIIMIMLFTLLVAIPNVLAGIGVLKRKQWGRVVSLVMGGLSILVGLYSILAMGKSIWDYGRLIQMGMVLPAEFHTRFLGNLALSLFFIVLWLGHAALNYTVLLNSKFAKEFR